MRIILAILLLVAFGTARAEEDRIEHITYDQFVAAVEAGGVKSVHLYNLSGIQGTMLIEERVVRFDTAHPMPPSTDPLLLRLLKQHGISHTQGVEPKFEESGFSFNWWSVMQLGILMTTALLLIAVQQLKILRRLEKTANQQPQQQRPDLT